MFNTRTARPEITVEIAKGWIRRWRKVREELNSMEYDLLMVLEWYGDPKEEIVYMNQGQATHKV